LVIDGGGSLRCALVGGNLAVLAEKNGWAGIIVHGCVRDTAEINACQIGVRALAAMPVRSVKKGGGEAEVTVTIAGVRIAPGQWIYADADGVLVADQALHA
jgi:regulator of ribonuclease activity A